MRLKNLFLMVFFLQFLILASAEDVRVFGSASSNTQYSSSTFNLNGAFDVSQYWSGYNNKNDCSATTDFVLIIPPGGCSPNVVTSDLLEEQNVPVFCKISSVQINPLIDVSKIKSIKFAGEKPKGIAGISYYPARAYINSQTSLEGSLIADNVGYLVVVLEKTPREKDMPDVINGTLTAVIDYDLSESSVSSSTFISSEMTDTEWEADYLDYSFMNGKGFVRIESIEEDSAQVGLYSSSSTPLGSFSLNEGETSSAVTLPGTYCKSKMKVKLNEIDYADDKVLLLVDSEQMWVSEGTKFLDNKCTVKTITPSGVGGGKISIYCSGVGTITLSLNTAKIELKKIESGQTSVARYGIGDVVKTQNSKSVYVAYAGQFPEADHKYVVLVERDSGTSNIDGLSSFIAERQEDWDGYGYRLAKVKWAGGGAAAILLGPAAGPFIMGGLGLGGAVAAQFLLAVSGDKYLLFYADVLSDIYTKYPEIQPGSIRILHYSDSSAIDSIYNSVSKAIKPVTDAAAAVAGTSTGVSVSETYSTLSGPGFDSDVPVSAVWLEKQISLTETIEDESLLESNSELKEYYESAIQDYNDVVDFYPDVSNPNSNQGSFAELSLLKAGELAMAVGDEKKASEMFKQLIEKYPDSFSANKARSLNEKVANSGISRDSKALVYVNGVGHYFQMNDLKEPTFEENGAVFSFNVNGKRSTVKNQIGHSKLIPEADFSFKILDMTEDTVTVQYSVPKTGFIESKKDSLQELIFDYKDSSTKILKLNELSQLNSNVTVRVIQINLKRSAKVTIVPEVEDSRSYVNFSFGVGIEKRAIQLSPEKTSRLMEKLKEDMEKWSDINEKLGKIVSTMKGVCFTTSTLLQVKTFFNGLSGESMARQEIMTSAGGWNDKCKKLTSEGKYLSVDDCLLKNSNQIDSDVQSYATQIANTNAQIQKIQAEVGSSSSGLFEESYDSNKIEQKYREEVFIPFYNANRDKTYTLKDGTTKKLSELIPESSIGSLDMSDMKDLVTLSSTSGSSGLNDMTNTKINNILTSASEKISMTRNYEGLQELTKSAYNEELPVLSSIGTGNSVATSMKSISKDSKLGQALGLTKSGDVFTTYVPATASNVSENLRGKNIVVSVERKGETYDFSRAIVVGENYNEETSNSIRKYLADNQVTSFTKADASLYKNKFKESVKVEYFERAPYKGLPALVPFDYDNGWYVATEYIVSGVGTPFDESGKAVNFWICNVGADGLVNFKSGDECRYYNLDSSADFDFPGLSSSESKKIVSKAQSALKTASQAYGKKQVTINGHVYDSGISTRSESGSCSDFMSPDDCNLMFNVCDPVICPASRCDLGGQYPVANVVQTGIIGSLLLCLPNAQEGIAVPICLTGVHAGIDNFISILNSTYQCMNESLENGEMIGICDEIQSIYLCEFFWKQAVPLLEIGIPKLFEGAFGQGTRGGGEYLTVQSSWDNMQDSVSYFNNEYAVESTKAFNLRSTESVGTTICNSFISTSYPNSAEFFDNLLAPDSPSQYTGWFSETELTDATMPPMSKYKVYYHIYSGKDIGATYQVYLKEPSDKSLINVAYSYLVDSGYIARGSQVDQAKDFTAVAGYTKMCISVNGQETCDFGQSSTSFALNYLKDEVIADEATSQITTTDSCIAGTSNLYTTLGLTSEAYKNGVIRVCSTTNPGAGVEFGTLENSSSSTDRWQKVGYCDNSEIGCWIDTNAVKAALAGNYAVLNQTLQSITDSHLKEVIESSQEITSNADAIFENVEKKIIGNRNVLNISEVNSEDSEVFEKLRLISEFGSSSWYKAKALYLRGRIYDLLTRGLITEILSSDVSVAERLLLEKNERVTAVLESGADISISIAEGQNKYRYSSENGCWEVSVDGKVWEEVTKVKESGQLNGEPFDVITSALVRELSGKNFEDGKILLAEEAKKYNAYGLTFVDSLESAIAFAKTLDPKGTYSKNEEVRQFIDSLRRNEMLTGEEWEEIYGEGIFNLEENMEYVVELLEKKIKLEDAKKLEEYKTHGNSCLISSIILSVSEDKIRSEFSNNGNCNGILIDGGIFRVVNEKDALNDFVGDDEMVLDFDFTFDSSSSYVLEKYFVDMLQGDYYISTYSGHFELLNLQSDSVRGGTLGGGQIPTSESSSTITQFNNAEISPTDTSTNKMSLDYAITQARSFGTLSQEEYNQEFLDNCVASGLITQSERMITVRNLGFTKVGMNYYLDLLVSKKNTQWTVLSALNEAKLRTGKYSDNSKFIDALHDQGILTDDEYVEITGEGVWNLEEDISFVTNLLEKKNNAVVPLVPEAKSEVIPETKWTLQSALAKAQTLSQTQGYSANKDFIDALHNQGILTDAEYEEINGGGYFDWNSEENMAYVVELLKNKINTQAGSAPSSNEDVVSSNSNLELWETIETTISRDQIDYMGYLETTLSTSPEGFKFEDYTFYHSDSGWDIYHSIELGEGHGFEKLTLNDLISSTSTDFELRMLARKVQVFSGEQSLFSSKGAYEVITSDEQSKSIDEPFVAVLYFDGVLTLSEYNQYKDKTLVSMSNLLLQKMARESKSN